jgi:hypothetical protein
MPPITIPNVTLRTTIDGDGFTHGLVTGTGPTPDDALSQLADLARRTVEQKSVCLPPATPPGSWRVALAERVPTVLQTPGDNA